MTAEQTPSWEQACEDAQELLNRATASDSGGLKRVRPLRLMIYAKRRYGITLTHQDAMNLIVGPGEALMTAEQTPSSQQACEDAWKYAYEGAQELLNRATASDSGGLKRVRPLRLMIYAKRRYGITLTHQEAMNLMVEPGEALLNESD